MKSAPRRMLMPSFFPKSIVSFPSSSASKSQLKKTGSSGSIHTMTQIGRRWPTVVGLISKTYHKKCCRAATSFPQGLDSRCSASRLTIPPRKPNIPLSTPYHATPYTQQDPCQHRRYCSARSRRSLYPRPYDRSRKMDSNLIPPAPTVPTGI